MKDKDELLVIQSKIYEIRGQKVMLDRDLAEMYGVLTKVLNQAVKRNPDRFPEDFMFQLTNEETQNWKSQLVTSNSIKMLNSVLTSKTALQINMSIMRAFVAIRHIAFTPPKDELQELQNDVRQLKEYIEDVFTDYNDINEDTRIQLELINKTLAELQIQKKLFNKSRNPIGFVKPKQ